MISSHRLKLVATRGYRGLLLVHGSCRASARAYGFGRGRSKRLGGERRRSSSCDYACRCGRLQATRSGDGCVRSIRAIQPRRNGRLRVSENVIANVKDKPPVINGVVDGPRARDADLHPRDKMESFWLGETLEIPLPALRRRAFRRSSLTIRPICI